MSCAVTAQLICTFVFALAKIRFSHDTAQIMGLFIGICWRKLPDFCDIGQTLFMVVISGLRLLTIWHMYQSIELAVFD